MYEYYTGLDASRLTDGQLVMRITHINKIRQMEKESRMPGNKEDNNG